MMKILLNGGMVILLTAGFRPSQIEPTPDLGLNFCNFPYAWSVSDGRGVVVEIVCSSVSKDWDWQGKVKQAAPGAKVGLITKDNFLSRNPIEPDNRIVLMAEQPTAAEFDRALRAIGVRQKVGVLVIVPAYFGPMSTGRNYEEWRSFLRDAWEEGALIVGVHGLYYELGDLSFWKTIPVDSFALHRSISGDKYCGADALIDKNLEEPAALVAAAAALLKSGNPRLTPADVRTAFRDKGRKIYWMAAEFPFDPGRIRVRPMLSPSGWKKNAELRRRQPRVVEIIEGFSLDAARILDLPDKASGQWAMESLNVADAQKIATGRGVTVAILDHMFDQEDAALKDRMVHPGCVAKGEPIFGVSGHGTWMARCLLQVAPDVKIMPVRVIGPWSNNRSDFSGSYIQGIDYAVDNGANIISLSHRPIHGGSQAALDQAIARASAKGVTFVYIHYYGRRSDVVVPNFIEAASFAEGKRMINVIGTNFTEDPTFPFTWGLSQTAPIIAGVVAMMKEADPFLMPEAICGILLRSGRRLASGDILLDAFLALKNVEQRRP